MKKYLLPKDGNFYKANLHSHSNLSDGKLSPEELKELYKRHGYSVFAYTDHDMLLPHHDLTDDTFLALSGYEIECNEDGSPLKKVDKTCHMCFIARTPDIDVQPCWHDTYAYIGNAKLHRDKVKRNENEPPYVRYHTPESLNEMIRIGREAGFFITYNHPTWSLENYEDYTKFEGLNAMEIFNYSCDVAGHQAYVPNMYNDMLRTGQKIFAVAADDNHNRVPEGDPLFDSCGGYVMIKADELKYEKITDALFAGNFYSSTGPEIHDLYIEDEEIHITCSNAVRVTLNTARRSAKAVNAPAGETINEAVFKLDREDGYIRLTVRDERGNCADTNAYFIEDLNLKGKEE